MRLLLLTLICVFPICLKAQFSISEPLLNSGKYAITDTVYMDPNGQDDQPGTFSQPVQSFQAALQKLPYGVEGVNGGNAYGLIMLKAGFYYTSNGFKQFENTWKSGNAYKNVSLEGMGEVVIGGTVDSFAKEHLLVLSGNHIFVKNIKLKYSRGIGILLNRNSETRQKHVLIEGVDVDSVGSFSMLLRNVDTIAVKNCTSFFASRPGNDTLNSPCQWPSGIKFYNSSHCRISDCEIAFTRGEGLNFHNSRMGEAFRNVLHDNGLNFYNDNSSKLSVHHNLIYNTPGLETTYWRNCPASTNEIRAPRGMLIANEGACDRGNFPVYDNCRTVCSLPDESFPNVDSMFVFNNILQNVGGAFAFWQGTTDIAGVNCIRNVFIFNNTIIGTLAMSGAPGTGMVNVFFPSYNILLNSFYGYLENVRITHNIFSYDTISYPEMRVVNMDFHHSHPGPKDVVFDANLWIQNNDYMGPNGMYRPGMPMEVPLLTNSVQDIQACDDHPELVYQTSAAFPWLTNDYSMNPRSPGTTNVGALEYSPVCDSTTAVQEYVKEDRLKTYPNPCEHCTSIFIEDADGVGSYDYQLISAIGEKVREGVSRGHRIDFTTPLQSGTYVLLLDKDGRQITRKLVVF